MRYFIAVLALLVLALLVLYYLVPKRFQWVVLLIGSLRVLRVRVPAVHGFIVITTLTTYFAPAAWTP